MISARQLIEIDVSELARALLGEELRRRYGATAEQGVPTSVPDGLHVVAATNGEIRAALDLARDAGVTFVDSRTLLLSPERVALDQAGARLVALHGSDLTVPNGYLPKVGPDTAAPNFGRAIAVVDGYAVAHLLMHDSRGVPGERVADDYVPAFNVVTNVWVAHRHRRSGIARALLEQARADYPLVELQRPFTPAGEAWAAACAPELVDVGRNSRCPCGSGAKFKRCCGTRGAT